MQISSYHCCKQGSPQKWCIKMNRRPERPRNFRSPDELRKFRSDDRFKQPSNLIQPTDKKPGDEPKGVNPKSKGKAQISSQSDFKDKAIG